MARLNLLRLVPMTFSASALAQVTWSALPGPITNTMAYDSVRDRLVVPGGFSGATWEFDGTSWSAIPASGGSWLMTFDRQRGRTVALSTGFTQEWDGAGWSIASTSPPMVGLYDLLTFHSGRAKVLALSPTYVPAPPWQRLELYEWDGATWTHITSSSPLVITNNGPGVSDVSYSACVYDAARDKLIVFGAWWYAGNQQVWSADTYEWDAVNGWVSFPGSGPAGHSLAWFDEHRGVVLRATMTTPTSTVLRWDPPQGWVPIGTLNNLPLWYNGGAYDSKRNRYYYGTSATSLAFVTDLNPASYAFHGAACPAPSQPALGLTFPWTRPWIGSLLDVTTANLPLSIAVLAMGFSDQTYGTTPLPLSLSPFGMPGCDLRVAPDATALLVGSNNSAACQIGIPGNQALVGLVFWQQALSLSPGANPAGLLTSASMRAIVGRAF